MPHRAAEAESSKTNQGKSKGKIERENRKHIRSRLYQVMKGILYDPLTNSRPIVRLTFLPSTTGKCVVRVVSL